MKILYLTNDISVLGGIEKVLQIKVNYFSNKYNYKIKIISQRNKYKENFFNIDKNVETQCLGIKIVNNFIIRHIQKIKYFFYLKKILQEKEFDIIITTGTILDSFLIFLKKYILIKEFHVSKNNTLNSNKKNFFKQKIENFYLSKYTKIIILTDEDKINWKLSNVEVIHNPLIFYSKKFSKCENKKLISVGRLVKQKGYDILIDVWNIISKKYPDWILEIYGEGSERENLQNKINKLGLEKSFLLKGIEKNIRDKYVESSIYVMSSRHEGMPMVLLEAMACGLSVVSFDCSCGPKDIIKDNEDGFLVKFGDIEQMAEKIEELIVNESKRKLFGKNARINVQRFSQDKIMNQWKKLFEDLMVEKSVK